MLQQSEYMQIVLNVNRVFIARLQHLFVAFYLLFTSIYCTYQYITVLDSQHNIKGCLHVFHNLQYFVAQRIRATDVWWQLDISVASHLQSLLRRNVLLFTDAQHICTDLYLERKFTLYQGCAINRILIAITILACHNYENNLFCFARL